MKARPPKDPHARNIRSRRTAAVRHRWAAVAGLPSSPISAEYLIGYSDSTNRPLELLAGP